MLKILMAFALAICLHLVLALVAAWPMMHLINYLFASDIISAVFGVTKMTFCKTFWFSLFVSWLISNRVKVSIK